MKNQLLLSRWTLLSGLLISIIGILHSAFAPMFYQQLSKIDALAGKAAGFVFFFAAFGFSIFYAGLMIAFASTGVKKSESWAQGVVIASSCFVALGGISGILYADFGNPMIYIMTTLALLNIILLIIPQFAKT